MGEAEQGRITGPLTNFICPIVKEGEDAKANRSDEKDQEAQADK
jgi:hypothetical protein